MSEKIRYREELLHWVWQTSRMEASCLATTRNEPISIYDVGVPNDTDGPDFLNARIQIGDLQWYGDVEIHWDAKDWDQHKHYSDPNYNRVILHVVWSEKHIKEVFRPDGSRIPTLSLQGKLSGALQSFINRYLKSSSLPCSGNLSYISQKAFEQQLQKAEREYFEQKVNDLLSFWNPTLPSSRAWLDMLALGLFDGLGIAYNRDPMRDLCNELIPLVSKIASEDELQALALSLSGLKSGNKNWTHKGSRPTNHPEARIKQAVSWLWYLQSLPFKNWLKADSEHLWDELNTQIRTNPGLGKQRRDILFGTVWLPSFFILGNTFASGPIKTRALNLWEQHRVRIPDALLKPFNDLDIHPSSYQYSLGAVYQLRTYCKPRQCNRCKVFKSAISS